MVHLWYSDDDDDDDDDDNDNDSLSLQRWKEMLIDKETPQARQPPRH